MGSPARASVEALLPASIESSPSGKPWWSSAQTAVVPAPAKTIPGTLASTAMVASAPEEKSPTVLAPTTDIPLAPVLQVVSDVPISTPPAKS